VIEMKIGTLTIGQSPRVDIIPELKKAIGFEVEIVERGALDNLTWKEVKNLYPGSNDYILVTRMRDGKEVKIAKRHVVERMKKCIADLERIDVDFIILLCTGEFPKEITSKKLILKPSKLLENMLRGILQEGVIADIVPSADQISLMEERWKRTNPNLKVIVDTVSPYTGTDAEIEKVAEKIAKTNANLIVLDCLGFNREVKTIFRKITEKPVLLPRTLLGRIAGELIEGQF
jgi:protein AroM